MAITNKNNEAIINLNEIIVSGDNSFNANLVAMKELPQKITARIINKYLEVWDFNYDILVIRNVFRIEINFVKVVDLTVCSEQPCLVVAPTY